MVTFMKTKWFYGIVISLSCIIVLLLVMKISATWNHDPTNPRSRPNAYLMTDSVLVNQPVETVFDFITYHFKEHWLGIAEAHKKIRITNAKGLTRGAVILCEEYENGEGVSHRYVVKEVIPNRLIFKASEPSTIYMASSSGEMKKRGWCNTYVYLDMEESCPGKTNLSQTLVIEMPNFIFKFLADIIGGEKGKEQWTNHLKEELQGLRNNIEKISLKEPLHSLGKQGDSMLK